MSFLSYRALEIEHNNRKNKVRLRVSHYLPLPPFPFGIS
jgi:hypothetical protein